MEVMVGGVTARVAIHPAVEIAGRVQGLGGVADEMTQNAQEENGVLTCVGDFLGVTGLFEGFQVGKSRLQPGVVLRDGPWKKTNQCFGAVEVVGRDDEIGRASCRERV